MRHSTRYLAVIACVALTGSVAHAQLAERYSKTAVEHRGKPSKKAKHRTKVAPPVDRRAASDEEAFVAEDEVEAIVRHGRSRISGTSRPTHVRERTEDADVDVEAIEILDDEVDAPANPRKVAKKSRAREESDSERVAFADDDVIDDRAELVDTRVKLRTTAAPRSKDWHVAIGPYLWASSVDANVSLGSASVDTGVDFMEIKRHARYGAELLAEGRYGRFSITGDMMYGVVAVNGSKEVGPLMVTLDGQASSLLVDGAAGYLLAGSDHSLLSIETRAGVRYQRTAIAGTVDIGGGTVASPKSVDAGGDAVAGARVVLRPSSRFYVSSAFDLGVFGVSNSTWSASADASLRVTSRLLLSLGWRTLAIDRAQVAMTMHGPRAAIQLLF